MEIWKPITGYEGLYSVSNLGNIKSLERVVPHGKSGTRRFPEKLKTPTDVHGYLYCHLYKNNSSKRFAVHRLVAEAFIPNLDGKPEVNHKDGDKHNNCVENLEWATKSENMRHAASIGLHSQYDRHGSKNPMYGKHHSEKARQKIGDAHKGLKHSEATRQKMGESHRGRKFSDDHKKALSQSLKIAKSGYRWVTDGTVSRHVPPEIASVLLSSGWRRGMAKKKHPQA